MDITMTPERAMQLVKEAEKMSPDQIATLQRERFRELVAYAREHSPFYREKYADLPENPDPAGVPPVSRSEITARFDDWVCDRSVTLNDVKKYLADMANAVNPFRGQYSILTTSGTTDVPLVILRDGRHGAVNGALLASRLFGGGKLGGIPRLREPGVKMLGIMAGEGYHSSYLSYLRTKLAYEKMGKGENIRMLPVSMPTEEKIRNLNEFQPEILAVYPSSLAILAMMQKEGDLRIHPLAMVCSAEFLPMETLHLAEEAFGAPVMNNYCSSEGGEVAFLCPENHMHVNTDWIMVEPVDADMKPVGPGEHSEGVLMTNLANLVQPVIRYYVTDRVALSDKACPCGSPFPYMEIEGRKEDILSFSGKRGRPVRVEPTLFTVNTMHVDGCLNAQYIQRSPDGLEIRYQSIRPENRKRVGEELLEKTRRDLSTFGAGNVRVWLSEEPLLVGKSGKIRFSFQDFHTNA